MPPPYRSRTIVPLFSAQRRRRTSPHVPPGAWIARRLTFRQQVPLHVLHHAIFDATLECFASRLIYVRRVGVCWKPWRGGVSRVRAAAGESAHLLAG